MIRRIRPDGIRKVPGPAATGMALLLGFTGVANAQLFTNSSFESDFANWTTSQGNGSASFTTPTTSPFSGSKSAQIAVTNAGTTYPSLTATFTASSSQTYLLRYFAKSSVNRPMMKIQVTSSGPSYSSAEYRPSSNGWEGYHWAFKASGSTTIKFTFEEAATFNLDQVQVFDTVNDLDHTGTHMDPEMHHLWRWGQDSVNGGMMNTDNDVSVELPDGRVVWLFNDTYTGTPKPYDNSPGISGFARNYMMIQNGTTLTPWVSGGNAFVPATSGNCYWPSDAFVEGNKLKVILDEVPASGPGPGSCVATLSLPGLSLDGISDYTPWHISKIVDGADGNFYIFNERKVAMVSKGDFDTFTEWKFWDGGNWVTNSASAIDLPNYQSVWSLVRLGPKNFAAISNGFVGGTMRASFAPTPAGPWTVSQVIATPAWEAMNSFYYMPYLHRQSVQNGVYSVGYSDIGDSGADGDGPYLSNRPGNDNCFYNIQFFKTPNLLDLSPYTTDFFSDTFTDNDPAEWKTYGGTWTAASGTYSVNSGRGYKAVALGVVNDEVVLEADVKANGGDAGVIFRGSDYAKGADNFKGYYACIKPGTGVVLGRMNSGSWTSIKTSTMTINNSVTYHLKVVASGTSIQVFVNDMSNPKINVTDTTYSSGSNGLRVYNSAATWDNFAVNMVTYELQPQNALGQRLDVSAANSSDGTNIQIWGDNNSAAQGWTLQDQGDGTWEIIPGCATGSRMEVSGTNNGGSGANVQLWSDHNGSDLRWHLLPVGDGLFEIAPGHNTGLSLNVVGGGTSNGTNVNIANPTGGSEQTWKLIRR